MFIHVHITVPKFVFSIVFVFLCIENQQFCFSANETNDMHRLTILSLTVQWVGNVDILCLDRSFKTLKVVERIEKEFLLTLPFIRFWQTYNLQIINPKILLDVVYLRVYFVDFLLDHFVIFRLLLLLDWRRAF